MKTKIVIASTLKPVDDVRTYWKFAQSMVKTNKGKYDVNIIGNAGKKASDFEDITFHPYKLFRDQYLKRLLARYHFFTKIWTLNPDIIIVTTHELLFASILYKLLKKKLLIYDIQENYALNATLRKSTIGKLLSWSISLKEKSVSKHIDHFILAEACYASELHYLKEEYTIIENKALSRSEVVRGQGVRLLFSGTISAYAGVMTAANIILEWLKRDPNAEALFIGQVHDRKLFAKLQALASTDDRIKLISSFEPVAYDQILAAMDWASIGIIGYQPNQVSKLKIPTKLYEYSRYQLPYLIQKDTLWEQKSMELGYGIPVDLEDVNITSVEITSDKINKLNVEPYPYESTWEYESKRLALLIKTLLNNS